MKYQFHKVTPFRHLLPLLYSKEFIDILEPVLLLPSILRFFRICLSPSPPIRN